MSILSPFRFWDIFKFTASLLQHIQYCYNKICYIVLQRMSDLWLRPRINLDCNAQKTKSHLNYTQSYLCSYFCCFVKEISCRNAELKMLSWLFISWALDFFILPGYQKLNKCLSVYKNNCFCICLSTDFFLKGHLGDFK